MPIAVSLVAASWMLVGSASAQDVSVAGREFVVVGTTVTKVSSRGKQRRPGQITIRFAEDTFEAPAVEGSYEQHGQRIRLEVSDALLAGWEGLWARDFADYLREQGHVVDEVACRAVKARLKGRSKQGALRLKTKYKFRCEASGDFGTKRARMRVRFKGRSEPREGAPVLTPFDPGAGLVLLLPVASPGEAGLTLTIGNGEAGNLLQASR